MENKYQIILDKSNRREIVIEEVEKIKKVIENAKKGEKSFHYGTFFHEEYLKAYTIIENIKASYNASEKDNPNKTKNTHPIFLKNNIITFTGSRGTGKTSAMVSFGEYLASKKEFKVLDMIDPSHFVKNESILLNVLTLLFKSVKAQLKNKNHISNELLKNFEKVFTSIKMMDESIPKESSLEYLDQLSDSLKLIENIKDLIEDSLKFFNEDVAPDSQSKYLVLMIDDLDVNVSHAPKMMEQIRKFLIHKNLIILLSANMDQLQFEMQEYYSKYFHKTFNVNSQTSDVCKEVEDMATKYLLKLLPPLQRIHIGNSADRLMSSWLKITNGKNKDNTDLIIEENELQKVILTLIWKKTRLIFIPRKDTLHSIIPTNLRALNQFIRTLIDMKDVEEPKDDEENNEHKIFRNKDEYDTIKENFFKFKDYILNVWIPSNLAFEEQRVFDNIPKDMLRINKHLIQSINVIGGKNKKRLIVKDVTMLKDERKEKNILDVDIYTFVSRNDPSFELANKISDVSNFPSNNSMGDILLLADKYKTYFESENENNFIEAIKIYYSLLLFETMFFDESSQFTINYDPEKTTGIQRLIGGTLYFPHYFDIIKCKVYEERIKQIEKIWEKIKGGKDINSVEELSQDDQDKFKEELSKKHFVIPTSNNNSIGKYLRGSGLEERVFYHEYDTKEIKNKNESEDKLFFTLYYGDSRPARSYNRHIYDTTRKEEDNKQVRFDILGLLVNILNPFHTLFRFYDNDEKKYGEKSKIYKDEWLCKINEKLIPNILFPVYSVDLMLFYLREQVNFEEINGKVEEPKTLENLTEIEKKLRQNNTISNYYNRLLDLTKDKLERINDNAIIFNRLKKIYNNSAEIFLADTTSTATDKKTKEKRENAQNTKSKPKSPKK
ncbi:MAG: hypothetical protein FWF65_05605 [Bacteroidetes bacterium]|nr:hypothetical protein [Bacteroidota bacterium]MCL1969024.1 hypothetical protein [Bacteroidota bacterium]